jgi:two-component system, OmpR family, KDP operon response regulator KdpE
MVHILLIEDETQIRRFLRMTLEAAGMTVAEAPNGRQGIAEATGSLPDLVILDLGLPDMDGVQVVRQLRALSAIPILILSARSDETQKVQALDAGADDYLTKPFGNEEMMARIRVLLRRRGAPTEGSDAPPFLFGDVSVDLPRRLVTRAGEAVHLTPIEFKLLAVLVHHAGKVLTHTVDPYLPAARGVGKRPCGTQPLPAHLHGPPAPETRTRRRPSGAYCYRDGCRLSAGGMRAFYFPAQAGVLFARFK